MTENQKDFEQQTPDEDRIHLKMFEGDNMQWWDKLKQPPASALKQIQAGRLKGKSDINPQWRYQVLTQLFGPCGVGWKYEIVKTWREEGSDGQVFAFADILLYVREVDNLWSNPIPGSGGSMLIAKESSGLHSNDEAYKMAITDALSVACKMLGVAADIYAGRWDGERYVQEDATINVEKQVELQSLVDETETDLKKLLDYAGVSNINQIITSQYEEIKAILEARKVSMREPGQEG
jgi:hypothetical protein